MEFTDPFVKDLITVAMRKRVHVVLCSTYSVARDLHAAIVSSPLLPFAQTSPGLMLRFTGNHLVFFLATDAPHWTNGLLAYELAGVHDYDGRTTAHERAFLQSRIRI